MKKLSFIIILASLLTWSTGLRAEILPENLLSVVKIAPEATPGGITAILGKPIKVEETRSKSIWYYDGGTVNMVISWNKKTGEFEQLAMNAKSMTPTNNFDEKLSAQILPGKTDVTLALKLLGTPSSMTIKGTRHELHYTYNSHVFRLFFRDNLLVDFTLIGRNTTGRPR